MQQMKVKVLKDKDGNIFTPKVSADSVYLSGSPVKLTERLEYIEGKLDEKLKTPAGGTVGQVIKKTSDGYAWGDDADSIYSGDKGITVDNKTITHTNAIAAGTASEGGTSRTLGFGGTFNIPSVTYDAQGHISGKGSVTLTMPSNPNTDTKVTSADNHYSPSSESASALNKDASSTTPATWGTTSLVTGVNISRDSKGHVTDLSLDSIRMPSNPDTTYTIAPGDNNGQIKVTPSVGGAYNVDLPGLKSAAYTESTDYAKLSHSHGIDNVKGLPQDLEGIHQSLESMQTSIDSKADNQTFVDSQKSLEDRIVAHTTNTANPHGVTAAQIGLSLSNGTITLGNDSITPLTANSTLNAGKVSGTLADSNIPDIDASKIKGKISVDQLPATALERCVVVADDAARFALTVSNVQVGDTVKVTGTNKMYMVVDSSKLSSEAGYEEYVTSTDWYAITGIPDTIDVSITGSAGSATMDSKGQIIKSTYIKDLSVKGQVITYTRGDNTTGTITTQDTTYNAFSKVAVGSTTIEADSGTDTLTLAAGNNITLTPDAANDKITISAKDTTYVAATSSTLGLVKSTPTGTTSGKDYAVEVKSDGTMKVNVPWTDNNTTYTFAAGSKAGTFTATPTVGDPQSVTITGFLPLTGGDISGVTKFTDTTDSTAPQNGAVVISGGLGVGKNIYADAVYNAVWNDLADCIPVDDACKVEPGYCYCFDGERYYKSTKYLDKGIIGINSDTYGINMGHKPGVNNQMDIAVAGFVLAYVDKEYEPGTPLTCTENGYLTEIKREDKIEYPERVVATYWKSEPKEYWGSSNSNRLVEVHGRKWVKVV